MPHKTVRHTIAQLVAPSLSEFAIGFALAVGLSVYLILATIFQANGMEDYIGVVLEEGNGNWQFFGGPAAEQLGDKLGSAPMVADLTVFFFWAILGFIAYYFVSFVQQLVSKELRFFKALASPTGHRQLLIREALLTLLVRLGATVGLIVLAGAVRDVILPEFLALIYRVPSLPYLFAAVNFLIGTALLLLTLHVLMVLLRILLLRTRLFFTKDSIAD